jgi:hypothetical protein
VTDPTSFDCQIATEEGPEPREQIDPTVRDDLDAIFSESERHGLRIQHAFPTYGSSGDVVGGQFGFRECLTYVYEPGWSTLPIDEYAEVEAVDHAWYRVDFDC